MKIALSFLFVLISSGALWAQNTGVSTETSRATIKVKPQTEAPVATTKVGAKGETSVVATEAEVEAEASAETKASAEAAAPATADSITPQITSPPPAKTVVASAPTVSFKPVVTKTYQPKRARTRVAKTEETPPPPPQKRIYRSGSASPTQTPYAVYRADQGYVAEAPLEPEQKEEPRSDYRASSYEKVKQTTRYTYEPNKRPKEIPSEDTQKLYESGETPTPGWSPPGSESAAKRAASPEVKEPFEDEEKIEYEFRSRREQKQAERRSQQSDEYVSRQLYKPGETPTPGWSPPGGYESEKSASDAARQDRELARQTKRQDREPSRPAKEEAEIPVVKHEDDRDYDEKRFNVANKFKSEELAPPPSAQDAGSEMAHAYAEFDRRYSGSLGKSKRELSELWGFQLRSMGLREGADGQEEVLGFRQKGMINLPKGSSRKGKYHSSTTNEHEGPGEAFSCMVVLWVDKAGKGKVVDGDALGDCFMPELLSSVPVNFER